MIEANRISSRNMKVIIFVISLVQFLVPNVQAVRWLQAINLDPNFRLLWSIGPTFKDITFELQVRTLGFIEFGFLRESNQIAGADIVVGWLNNQQVYFQDRHVKSDYDMLVDNFQHEPEIDSSQDYQLVLGYENKTHTVLRFWRKLDTCDPQDVPITNNTMRIFWNYQPHDPVNNAVGKGSLVQKYRGNKGTASLKLFDRLLNRPKFYEDANRANNYHHNNNQNNNINRNRIYQWDLRNSEIENPVNSDFFTLIWCKVFQIPTELNLKHHIIKYEGIVDESNETRSNYRLEQMIVYECENNKYLEALSVENNGKGRQCFEPGYTPYSCKQPVASWTRGSDRFLYPPDAGYPLEATAKSRFYLMETHYSRHYNDNFENNNAADIAAGAAAGNDDTFIDTSGIRFFYTPNLRKHDVGLLSVGIDPSWRHIVPPGRKQVISSGHCISDCTRKAFSSTNGIKIFATMPKTHRTGRSVKLRHIRYQTELSPVFEDDAFDYEHTDFRYVRNSNLVSVLPGDHLVTECGYDTTERSAITLGGSTSHEELCIMFTMYYPKQNSLHTCHSIPSMPTVLNSLGIERLMPGSNPVLISAPNNLAGMTLERRLLTYDWENQINYFQNVILHGSFKPLCWSSSMVFLPGTERLESHFPNLTYEYKDLSAFDHNKCYVPAVPLPSNNYNGNNNNNNENDLLADTNENFNQIEQIKQKVYRSSSTMPNVEQLFNPSSSSSPQLLSIDLSRKLLMVSFLFTVSYTLIVSCR